MESSDLNPRAKRFEAQFAEVRTAYGSPLLPRARHEVMRLTERLSLVERQIAQVEAERDGVARSGAKLSIVDSPEGSGAQAAAKIAMLARLKGIGENDATLLIHEIFYREFRDRRELASWVGITPTPWASGDKQRDQGIARRWSGLDPRRTHPNGLALGALSARECPLHMVRRAHRGEPRTDPPCDDRCACPQATHRSLAVLGERSCTVRRQARLTQRPHCSSPAGRGRRWAGW